MAPEPDGRAVLEDLVTAILQVRDATHGPIERNGVEWTAVERNLERADCYLNDTQLRSGHSITPRRASHDQIESELAQLREERHALIAELAEANRDPARTYVAGAPLHHEIVRTFRRFKTQRLNGACAKLFTWLREHAPGLLQDRRLNVARLRARLCRHALLVPRQRMALADQVHAISEQLMALDDVLDEVSVGAQRADVLADALAASRQPVHQRACEALRTFVDAPCQPGSPEGRGIEQSGQPTKPSPRHDHPLRSVSLRRRRQGTRNRGPLGDRPAREYRRADKLTSKPPPLKPLQADVGGQALSGRSFLVLHPKCLSTHDLMFRAAIANRTPRHVMKQPQDHRQQESDEHLDAVWLDLIEAVNVDVHDLPHPPHDLLSEVSRCLDEAHDLVAEILAAEPPAELCVASAGSPFLEDEHEVARGYDGEGEVLLTTYPGYRVRDRLLEKTEVVTAPAVAKADAVRDRGTA